MRFAESMKRLSSTVILRPDEGWRGSRRHSTLSAIMFALRLYNSFRMSNPTPVHTLSAVYINCLGQD
jgi:hypothetical protein